jgi:beta-galactosidase
MAGCRVTEYDMVRPEKPGQVEMAATGRLYDAFGWCDLLAAEGADTVARYAAEFYKGTAAVTVNRVGKGRVYYVGASAEDAFYDDFLAAILSEAGVAMLPILPPQVEVLERTNTGWQATRGTQRKKGRVLVVVNYSGEARSADIAAEGKDLLGGGKIGPKIELEAYGVRVVQV